MTSSVNDGSGVDEQHKQLETHTQSQSPATGIFQSEAHPYTEYMMPSNLEAGHAMAHAAYPYPDPYYRSIFTPYSAQTMIPPPVLGIQQAVVPLPSSDTVEEPVYVNVKQYHGIMRRRQSRAKAESENKLVKSRKPYLHESRHLHAQKRARGCGGRFLNGKTDEKQQNKDFPREKEQINDNGKSDSDLKPDENHGTSCNRQANTDQGR